MRTPSLRSRIMVAGIAIVTVLVVGLDAFVYISLRDRLNETLDAVLDARLQLTTELVQQGGNPDRVVVRLGQLGVPALIEFPDGRRVRTDPAARRFDENLPVDPAASSPRSRSRTARLASGATVTVFVSLGGAQATLDRVLLLEVVGSLVAVALSVLLLLRLSSIVLRPVDRLTTVARRTAAGTTGARLRPDRPDSELGRMAVAFDEMLDALEAALDDAQAAEARSRRFLADAAHQLRTPVAGLRASVETLLRDPDQPQREQLLSNLAREAARAGRLVSSLLRIAHLDQSTTPTRSRIDVVDLITAEITRIRELAPHLDVGFDLDDHDTVVADVDPDGVREALTNLLDNARRYADRRIDVTLAMNDAAVEIRVRDDGPGLNPDEAQHAFERFVTLDEHGGSGLGLPIARAVARAHGGEVSYQAGWFVLRLPRFEPDISPFAPADRRRRQHNPDGRTAPSSPAAG